MKATIELNDDLYRRLKATAALRGRKIKELVAEGIALVLREETRLGENVPLPLIESGTPGSLHIPDDVASTLELREDLLRDEASLRQ